jgi:tripeptide aminopeptidase
MDERIKTTEIKETEIRGTEIRETEIGETEIKKIKINEDRIWREFQELVSLDSVSFEEREMADALTHRLEELGFQVSEDDAGSHYGGNAGNVYGFLKGTLPGDPILLSAHMDTVTPGIGKKAVLHGDGTITSKGDTVLGADDINGLVSILEAVRCIKEAEIPHRDIEVLFPIAEELYCKGTDVMDFGKIRSKEAYVLDMGGRPGEAAMQAPTILSFTVTVHGKASHAGFRPDRGIHAIRIMSEALSKVKQGQLPNGTTRNIGKIWGGEATNIVPETCVCQGEIRSYSHEEALQSVEEMRSIFEETLEETGATFDIDTQVHVHAYQTDTELPVVKRFVQVCREMGLAGTLIRTFGGSDNNQFALHGIPGLVLSCGMNQVHSVEEYTSIEDLKLCVEMVAKLITAEI